MLLVNTNGVVDNHFSKCSRNGVNLLVVFITQYDILSLKERLSKRNIVPYLYNTAVTYVDVQR